MNRLTRERAIEESPQLEQSLWATLEGHFGNVNAGDLPQVDQTSRRQCRLETL